MKKNVFDSIRQSEPTVIPYHRGTPYSVLLPIVEENGEDAVLFEVRSSRLKDQPGDICFPGGKNEHGETLEETAVRETLEELMIYPAQITNVLELCTTFGPKGDMVKAYVGRLLSYDGSFSDDEVEEVFTIPLRELLEMKPEEHDLILHPVPGPDFPYDLLPGGKDYGFTDRTQQMQFYKTAKGTVFGLTARILHEFLRKCK